MSTPIDRPKEPQTPLDNQTSIRNGEKKIWRGRSVKQDVNSSEKKIISTGENPPPSSLSKKKLVQVESVKKNPISPGTDDGSSDQIEKPQTKKQKLPPKKQNFLESEITALEDKYKQDLKSLPAFIKRIYFEATKRENLLAETTREERIGLEKRNPGGYEGEQFLIIEKKVSDYVAQQPKNVQNIFQPILETLQRSKKGFLGQDVQRKSADPQIKARIKEELAQSNEESVKNTPIGASILIPAGYHVKEAGQGHAVLLVATRTSASKFKLQIYNTGFGLDRHQSTSTHPKKFYPKVFENVDSEKLTKDFFTKLSRINNLENGEESPDKLPFLLEELINNELGVLESPEASRNEKPYYDQGPIGRCAYSPFSRYVHNTVKNHEGEYAKYKLYTTASLITEYSTQLDEEISSGSIHKIQEVSQEQFEKFMTIGEETLKDRNEKIDWISSGKRADPQFILELVQKNGRSLRFGSEQIRANTVIAKAAIRNDPKAIYYVHPNLKNDPEFMKYAVSVDPKLLSHAPAILKNNIDFMIDLISMYPEHATEILEYVSDELKNNPDFWPRYYASCM